MSAQTKCDRCGCVGDPKDFERAFIVRDDSPTPRTTLYPNRTQNGTTVGEPLTPHPIDLCAVCRIAPLAFLRPPEVWK